jgi:2-amino-4-hydroxy-6-hydroxymethyldihydropteridine diphosphokinase
MTRAYLSLGSNLGDRLRYLRHVVQALHEAGARHAADGVPGVQVLRVSPVYETAPLGADGEVRVDQPAFLNAVVELQVAITPLELRWLTAGIEVAHGRTGGPGYEPRTVDIDVLLVGDSIIERPELTLPHPRMWTRGFVMRPLDDLLPGVFPPWEGTGVEWFAAAEAIALPSPTREATRPANVL